MTEIRLHTCDETCLPECGGDGSCSVMRAGGLTIDVHCHVFVPGAAKMAARHSGKQREENEFLAQMGNESVRHNREVMLPRAAHKLLSVTQRLADMDAMGVDIQLLSPAPDQYYYWADRELADQLVSVQNQAIAELCKQHPQRLIGLGMVSLQHPELAVKQLEHACLELGLFGVEVSTFVDGAELSDQRFWPFWEKAEALGVVVFIHPFASGVADRLVPYYLSNVMGQPLETSLALSHLIFSGTLDRFPALRILAAHGGGYLPQYTGRSDHAAEVRPECSNLARQPSEYLRNIWFDSLVYNSTSLLHLIQQVGLDRVVVGTDYPFDMGCYDIHQLIEGIPDLKDDERQAILSGNAIELLQLTDHAILSHHLSSVSSESDADVTNVDDSSHERI